MGQPEYGNNIRLSAAERSKQLKSVAIRVGAAACAALSLFGAASSRTTAAEAMANCWNGPGVYNYAGVKDKETPDGFGATITETASPDVSDGHVAGWIGFGAEGLGPGGTNEWLQAGIERTAGQPVSQLYYEIALPHHAPVHTFLGQAALDSPETFQFTRLSVKPEEWVLSVNGRRRGPVFKMTAGHQPWRVDFMGESWRHYTVGCNSFEYKYKNMTVRQTMSGGWHAPAQAETYTRGGQDYSVEDLTETSFIATNQAGAS